MNLDCQTCGACCCSITPELEWFVDTTWTDERKLGRPFVRLNVIRPTQPGMTATGIRVPHGAIKTKTLGDRTVCVALEGDVGEQVKCSVYAKRPRACRSACEPGDAVCLGLRKLQGLD